MRFRGGNKGGAHVPWGDHCPNRRLSKDFIPLSPPSEGTLGSWGLQAGRGPSSGNRIGQPLTWDFLASRTLRVSWAHYFVLAAPGWLRQTWRLLISLIMGFVLYFPWISGPACEAYLWSPHGLPMTDPPIGSRAFPQSASCWLKLPTGIQGVIILEEISVAQTKST